MNDVDDLTHYMEATSRMRVRAEAAETERDNAVTLADTVLRKAAEVAQERDRLTVAVQRAQETYPGAHDDGCEWYTECNCYLAAALAATPEPEACKHRWAADMREEYRDQWGVYYAPVTPSGYSFRHPEYVEAVFCRDCGEAPDA